MVLGVNLVGGSGPGEGAFVGVVVGDVGIDLLDQLTHVAERTAPDRLVADEREPALYLVEPTRVSRRVMDVEARMAGEPGLDPRMLVRCVVVSDQMDRQIPGNMVVEVVEKRHELLVPMARFALGDDRAVEQCGRGNPRLLSA